MCDKPVMDMGAAILLGGGMVGLFGLLGYHAVKTKRDAAAMVREAASRGWSYTPGTAPQIYTIAGQYEGQELTISCRRPIGWGGQNSGSGPSVTTFTLSAPKFGKTVALVPRLPEGVAGKIGGEMINRLILRDSASVLAGTQEVRERIEPGVVALWTVHEGDPGAARTMLDPSNAARLLEANEQLGPKRPLVLLRYDERVELRVPDTIKRFEEIDLLVRLVASMI